MPKFYVRSGSLQLITTATDPRAAAIWAVHRSLSPSLPFLSDTDPANTPNSSSPRPQLGETIVVGERGFGSADSRELDTLGVVTEWTQLLLAVDRLSKRLATV
ncbi:MAG: hypothetical protein L0211_14925 [Planctomycetaceae bacterium]|nr:hypothetical protein [Planctomycetaceae bacterium]